MANGNQINGSKTACRRAFTDTLLALAREDPDIYVVTTDASGSVTLGDYAQALPGQFVEMGIAEQDSVGVAAGLALSGKNVFVCGPACFVSARSYEQVKVDVAYNHTNVTVVGVSGGVSYGPLGATHTTLQDVAQMRVLPGMTVVLPADGAQAACLTRKLAAHEGPAYFRMGRGAVPDVYPEGTEFELGRAHLAREGGDLTLLACGETVYYALEAAGLLEAEGVSARVLDIHTIKPLDEEAVLRAAAETGRVLTVEEHSVHGGLGGAVAELLAQRHPVPMAILGLPDENLAAGNSGELFARYGIDGAGIRRAALELLRR